MEFEFDKEIDAILRKARESEFAFADDPKSVIQNSKSLHLDADEISAFAENALPEKAKRLYTAHFAECDRCRRILSNLIILNAEAGTIPASLPVTEAVSETSIPWYRKLFAMPNLAYTMGAFVLVFGGFLSVLVLQNLDKPESSLSQATEPTAKERGPSASQDSAFANSNAASATSNATTANTAAVSTNSAANAPGAPINNVAASNTATTTANHVYSSNLTAAARDQADDSAVADLSRNQPAPPPPAMPSSAPAAPVTESSSAPEKQKEELRERKKAIIPAATPPPSAMTGGQASSPKRSAERNDQDEAELAKPRGESESATRQVAGKTFRRNGSVWTDSQYRVGTLLRNISRGSNDYKNLDGRLKNIAENLDGIVIVVWKSKGYRIQ